MSTPVTPDLLKWFVDVFNRRAQDEQDRVAAILARADTAWERIKCEPPTCGKSHSPTGG